MLAVLTLIGAAIGAGLGGLATSDKIELICQNTVEIKDNGNVDLEFCAFVASRTVAFSCDILAIGLSFICLIVIIASFIKEELLRPCKILIRVMFCISTIFLVIALIPGPALVSDYFSMSIPPSVQQIFDYFGWGEELDPETLRQQWYSTLIAAVFSLATMLTTCICPP